MGFLLFLFLSCAGMHLQSLAADEVGPGANLGGDFVTTGQLLVHALSEELGSLEEWRLVNVSYRRVRVAGNIPWAP